MYVSNYVIYSSKISVLLTYKFCVISVSLPDASIVEIT